MNIGRMQTLSHHLRNNIQPHEWNYGVWTQCALGHACRMPEFNRDGLHFHELAGPTFGGRHGMHAPCVFFDIKPGQAVHLFCEGRVREYLGGLKFQHFDVPPQEIADRIDRMIAEELHARANADVAAVTKEDVAVPA